MRRVSVRIMCIGVLASLFVASTATAASDMAASANIAQTTKTWSANVGDFDGDNWDDWILVRHEGPSGDTATLYKNTGGSFRVEKNLESEDRHDCAWGDVNDDGLQDFFCTVGADLGTSTTKDNELWIQRADGTWDERGVLYGVNDSLGRGRYSTFVDANGDRFPDLYISNFFPRKDDLTSDNKLLINHLGERFRSAPEFGLDRELGGFCVQAVDYDRDGWEDLLVCGKHDLRLYRNINGNSYRDMTAEANLGNFWNFALLESFDGDARPDLAQVKGRVVRVRLQTAGGRFPQPSFSMRLDAGESLAAGDINMDGANDLYVVEACATANGSNKPDHMLVNNGRGTDFNEMTIPQVGAGCGDVASAIDFDRDGRDDFIVLNGNKRDSGPVQLISFP